MNPGRLLKFCNCMTSYGVKTDVKNWSTCRWWKCHQKACCCSEFTVATEVVSSFPNPSGLKIMCFVRGIECEDGRGWLITERPKISVHRKSRMHEREGLKALPRFTATHPPLPPSNRPHHHTQHREQPPLPPLPCGLHQVNTTGLQDWRRDQQGFHSI